MERATFGGGCFWCTEAAMKELEGVESVTSGYAGGHVEDPSYREVCAGNTGHAEVVQVEYDPDVIGYDELLEVFFATHDPTQLNRQGPDVGTQYRSIVLSHDEDQRRQAEAYIEALDEGVRRRRGDRTRVPRDVLSRRGETPGLLREESERRLLYDARSPESREGSRKVRTEDEIGGRSALTGAPRAVVELSRARCCRALTSTLSPNSHERTDSERPRVFSQAADHPGVI